MSASDTEDTCKYIVVVNHEEQYSIWPDYKEIPAGWTACDKSGYKQECLDYINEVWTDMRPLSLRKKMDKNLTHTH
jgi:MbtH protein